MRSTINQLEGEQEKWLKRAEESQTAIQNLTALLESHKKEIDELKKRKNEEVKVKNIEIEVEVAGEEEKEEEEKVRDEGEEIIGTEEKCTLPSPSNKERGSSTKTQSDSVIKIPTEIEVDEKVDTTEDVMLDLPISIKKKSKRARETTVTRDDKEEDEETGRKKKKKKPKRSEEGLPPSDGLDGSYAKSRRMKQINKRCLGGCNQDPFGLMFSCSQCGRKAHSRCARKLSSSSKGQLKGCSFTCGDCLNLEVEEEE